MADNSTVRLKEWFSEGSRVVSAKEMMDFWRSLTEEEKDYYRTAELG